jgi:RsiW-degrading membrane proteinase PrsW (M82 family)
MASLPVAPFIVLAIAPGIFWLWYFYHRDKVKPEPLSWVVYVYLIGLAIVIPVGLTEGLIGLFVPAFAIAVIVAPIIEEYSKYAVVRHTVYKSPEFDEPVDGIVYAAAAALGFATLENVLYVFSSADITGAITTGLFRSVISVPGHALFSIIWGDALGRAKFLPISQRRRVILTGLFTAMFFHGLFNFLLDYDIGFAVVVLVLTPFMWWLVNRDIVRALQWHRLKARSPVPAQPPGPE